MNYNGQGISSANCCFFEILGSGGFLLADRRGDQEKIAGNGTGAVFYVNFTDIPDKIQYYLNHEDEREQIAEVGCKTVQEEHTYIEMAKETLSVIGL